MVVNLFANALEKQRILPEPLVKANHLFLENMETMMVFQLNALKSCLDIGFNPMKAAAEVNGGIISLQDLCQRQTEIAQTVQRKIMSDAKAMSSLTTCFQTEMDRLAKAALQEALPKAA